MSKELLPKLKPNSEPLPKGIASAQLVANAMLCAVNYKGQHSFNYYWKRGKCKGSKCIFCGLIDRNLKP